MNVRDRIVGFHRLPAAMLKVNPENPRLHGERERAVFGELLERIGFAGALLTFRNEDGELELVDGELRQKLMADGDQEIPILETDLTRAEARELLLFFDRVSGMADYDPSVTLELVDSLELETGALSSLAQEMADEAQIEGLAAELDGSNPTGGGTRQPIRSNRENKRAGRDLGPAPIKVVISVSDLALVERAIFETHERNRGTALAMLARSFLQDIGQGDDT